jgi:hypothetical protein
MKRTMPARLEIPARSAARPSARSLPPRPQHVIPARSYHPAAPRGNVKPKLPPKRQVDRILEPSESSLLDVVDNLLNSGVVLNADLILALAGVDLVYVRLSALLCAADRVLPRDPTG